MLSAVIASACCWLPLLLIVFGVSAVGVSAFFETLRPWFIGIAAVLLAAGFYLTYVRRDPCEDGEACDRRMDATRRTSRIMLWLATAGVVAFALFPTYSGALLGREAVADGAPTEIILEISGMTCAGCSATVEHALRSVPGVAGAKVDYEQSRAVVLLDPTRPAAERDLISAVDRTGFEATPVLDK